MIILRKIMYPEYSITLRFAMQQSWTLTSDRGTQITAAGSIVLTYAYPWLRCGGVQQSYESEMVHGINTPVVYTRNSIKRMCARPTAPRSMQFHPVPQASYMYPEVTPPPAPIEIIQYSAVQVQIKICPWKLYLHAVDDQYYGIKMNSTIFAA